MPDRWIGIPTRFRGPVELGSQRSENGRHRVIPPSIEGPTCFSEVSQRQPIGDSRLLGLLVIPDHRASGMIASPLRDILSRINESTGFVRMAPITATHLQAAGGCRVSGIIGSASRKDRYSSPRWKPPPRSYSTTPSAADRRDGIGDHDAFLAEIGGRRAVWFETARHRRRRASAPRRSGAGRGDRLECRFDDPLQRRGGWDARPDRGPRYRA